MGQIKTKMAPNSKMVAIMEKSFEWPRNLCAKKWKTVVVSYAPSALRLWVSAHFPLLGFQGLRPLEAVVIRLATPALTGGTAAVSEIIATLLTTHLQF